MGKHQAGSEDEKRQVVRRIEFLPEAAQDVTDACDWYEDRLPGLGEDFLLSVDDAVNHIARNPLLSGLVYKSARKHKLRRFPFGVFYLIEADTILILAVIHLSRHPLRWKPRLKK